ncbi:AAA family ATPase [Planktothrix agardhii]|uniref:AAA family ATPase n=1 Tax=Planktothrix agardhii TaxID=1160 RepID=UPI001D0BA635|nr:AAA family ATPase [Planktothrix agardhii]MCB8788927.1 AAA family ATPase [Planktothrix agardhii 1025]MCF3614225.1 AAA family ATPase [Planktothrix agardhii 1027]MCF3647846.1 AAA family ATPase [Planktothrix agardhii 1026]
MRLYCLWVREFKNLREVTINFDENHWVTVVIGWNGTGKSNVLEALATLFRDLIVGKNENKEENKPSFSYRIAYRCRGNFIYIDADLKRVKDAYKIYVKPINDSEQPTNFVQMSLLEDEPENSTKNWGKRIVLSHFMREQEQYLPKYIFGYYSGHSSRMEEVFRKYLADYDKALRNGKDPGLRRLFYALPIHSQFVLLAFIIQQDNIVRDFLDNQLGLDPESGIDSVLFVLRQPPWNSKVGDPRFWNARGVVSDFLARLYDVSLAPIRIKRRVDASLWNKKTTEFLYLYVKDMEALRELVGEKHPREFFRDIESTYVSELIEEVRIRVKLRKNDGSVTFRELSEGEQQLLTVLGLLRFTAEEESLFLLDEPDTHLNPVWSVKYLDYLKQFVGMGDVNQETTHVLLTTHNPLAIAELVKEQVQILKRNMDNLEINVSPPEEDPRGMGYAGILTSDMFDLPASLDNYTLSLLARKRELSLSETPLDNTRKEELKKLNDELESYGFRHEARDPLFTEYLRARHDYQKALEEQRSKEVLPTEDQRKVALELMKKIMSKNEDS